MITQFSFTIFYFILQTFKNLMKKDKKKYKNIYPSGENRIESEENRVYLKAISIVRGIS